MIPADRSIFRDPDPASLFMLFDVCDNVAYRCDLFQILAWDLYGKFFLKSHCQLKRSRNLREDPL